MGRTAPVVDLSGGAFGVTNVRNGVVVCFIFGMVQDGTEILSGEIHVVCGKTLSYIVSCRNLGVRESGPRTGSNVRNS